ncbi:hypothetical protein IW261DRAFT_1567058 [Armillaria novae-zelandiae]|uniref:Uncharacterized protein n=1 Tax=Armillaria novae-zelandiae TaxID=153914 RepID=A0AA39P2J1_9AGAR|nr:hypothetical protein IW261DRAFT_1567058 [Armillaria novae-zelandiae]
MPKKVERELTDSARFLFHDYSHMSRPKKYHTQEARLQAIRENSNRYYTKHRHDISARRKLAYQTKSSHHVGEKTFPITPQVAPPKVRNTSQSTSYKGLHSTSKFITRLKKIQNTSQYEVISVPETAPKVPPPPDPFPKFNAEVLKILQQFEDFLVGKTPSDYVKSLLRCYFKDSSRRQGEIGLFVEPLDVLYKMQEAHRSISMQALQADGPSKRQKRLDCAGNGIGTLIRGWRIYGVLELMVPMVYVSHTTGIG